MYELDEMTVMYFRTTVTQLQKKLKQITKIDQEICTLIEDANTLEETNVDSEELQDTLIKNINKLNKHIELHSQSLSKRLGDDHTGTIPETQNNSDTSGDSREATATEASIENIENASAIASTPQSTTVLDRYQLTFCWMRELKDLLYTQS